LRLTLTQRPPLVVPLLPSKKPLQHPRLLQLQPLKRQKQPLLLQKRLLHLPNLLLPLSLKEVPLPHRPLRKLLLRSEVLVLRPASR
jgi:hypothetical protein